jgi:hypothetical protein
VDEQAAIGEIIRLFEDPQGFLVQLRGPMVFNEQLYQKIIVALAKYLDLLGDNKNINRRVARFLFDLNLSLAGEAYQFSLRQHPDAQRVRNAHAQIVELLFKFLP